MLDPLADEMRLRSVTADMAPQSNFPAVRNAPRVLRPPYSPILGQQDY
jgi:hypothetical protein